MTADALSHSTFVREEIERQPRAWVTAAALADEKVQAFLSGASPKKVIVVPGKLVNLVV